MAQYHHHHHHQQQQQQQQQQPAVKYGNVLLKRELSRFFSDKRKVKNTLL
jgi:hypothetical protein